AEYSLRSRVKLLHPPIRIHGDDAIERRVEEYAAKRLQCSIWIHSGFTSSINYADATSAFLRITILSKLQFCDKVFLLGRSRRENGLPIVFVLRMIQPLAIASFQALSNLPRATYGIDPFPIPHRRRHHQKARGPHAPYQPRA